MNATERRNSFQYSTESIEPFFQPIVDLNDSKIFAYEVLGRNVNPETGKVDSLGPLFHSFENSGEEHIEQIMALDNIIREKAIAKLARENQDACLFININPGFLSRLYPGDFDPEQFQISRLLKEHNLSPDRIILEITEDEFEGDFNRLVSMVRALKSYGYRIAVDDLGAGMSGLARLAYILPDIIKVDLNLLRNSLTHSGFHQLLSAIAFVSHRLGADLLFEGIEEEEEITAALKLDGRYLQGYYFSKAEANFQNAGFYQNQVKEMLETFSRFRIVELMQNIQRRESILVDFQEVLKDIKLDNPAQIDDELTRILKLAPTHAQSLALYDFLGNQVSSSFYRIANSVDKHWDKQPNINPPNIGWRSFFQQALAKYRFSRNHFHITEPYHDLENGFPRVTASLVLEMDKGYMLVTEMELDWRE